VGVVQAGHHVLAVGRLAVGGRRGGELPPRAQVHQVGSHGGGAQVEGQATAFALGVLLLHGDEAATDQHGGDAPVRPSERGGKLAEGGQIGPFEVAAQGVPEPRQVRPLVLQGWLGEAEVELVHVGLEAAPGDGQGQGDLVLHLGDGGNVDRRRAPHVGLAGQAVAGHQLPGAQML